MFFSELQNANCEIGENIKWSGGLGVMGENTAGNVKTVQYSNFDVKGFRFLSLES